MAIIGITTGTLAVLFITIYDPPVQFFIDFSNNRPSEVLALHKMKGQACIGKNIDKIDSHLLNLII